MGTSDKIELALEILREKGHQTGPDSSSGGFVNSEGQVLVKIDQQMYTYTQVYELAGLSVS